MAITIKSGKFSFIQFGLTDEISNCDEGTIINCLPVYADNDIAFQFKLITSTPEEAALLCDLTNSHLEIGITDQCADDFLMIFSGKTGRYKVNDNTFLYYWSGLPGFSSVISVGECFRIKIRVNGSTTFCSNCLSRIGDACHTAVLDYSNDDDAFDFDYCGGSLIGESSDVVCEPTIVEFTNKATLIIPYTTSLQDMYGPIPTIQVWISDPITGDLVDMGIRVSFDTFPPSLLKFDFGGTSSGIIKIS